MDNNIKKLHGYQSCEPESFKPGKTIGIDGDIYDLLDFDSSYLTLERIAHSLAKQGRYLGNTGNAMDEGYSVAQHSYYMALTFLLSGQLGKAKQALFHDAAEAVLSDISSPLKRMLGGLGKLEEIEKHIEKKIAKRFKYKYPYDDDVMVVDKNSAQLEMSVMMKDKIFTDYWSIRHAYQMWLEMYDIICKMEEWAEIKANQENFHT